VARANRETGLHCLYAPNVTAPADELLRRARFAKGCGSGALLVSPGLAGFDAMRRLADDAALDLPVLAHPALLGTFTAAPDHGISHHALYGQIMRLAGADASIYPHAGGRFSFTETDCRSIAAGTQVPMGALRSIFPAPGGGMTLKRGEELKAFYGSEAMYLVGGDLLRHSTDIEANCRLFREMVETA
jgi:ribulose-bisphosphate carboxylase large chain